MTSETIYRVEYVCSDGRVRHGTGPCPFPLDAPGAVEEFARQLAAHEGCESVSIAHWEALGTVHTGTTP